MKAPALKLKGKLGNFDPYAQRFETLLGNPIFKKYPDFKEMLDYLASENCQGCRNEQCKLFKNCGVRPCHQEKQIDFCYRHNFRRDPGPVHKYGPGSANTPGLLSG